MPFGEMSITLDDVSCLLHLPIRGVFWSPQDVTEEVVVELVVDYLGVSKDKTFTLVEARYLLLFTDLDRCSGYSWGAAALVTLYKYLGDASMYSCKQLGEYPTLLQCWIHEYFPTVGKRRENWKPADNYELTPADVIWHPFEDHRAWHLFDEICLYRGCLKWGDTVVPYLPDRCLRQFGYRQYVPSPPLDFMMATDIDVDWIGYHQSVIVVIRPTTLATTPSDVENGYLE
ncbi:hypothetical protein KIW84_054559 [Lathyrus oleraceus]|uniref:Aminotransferase-like plant mobile domain-containing protein n=1 Tax=Pisum sativum TaxID=3888 RepID=A0A9D4WVY0_PEA|nr:hypothetical protein KIW84_054559 [Pisum sativum]